MADIGKNITATVSGDKKKQTLTIEIDLSKTLGESKSGKSTIVATTGGNVLVPGTDVTLGLNLYRKN